MPTRTPRTHRVRGPEPLEARDTPSVGGVASGDVNGDGYRDLIVASGAGAAPSVAVFSGKDGTDLNAGAGRVSPLSADFRGGLSVACADVDGDGYDDLIVGAGAGGGPRVQVFSGKDVGGAAAAVPLFDFIAYDPAFSGGVFVAGGDVNGDGFAEVVTGPGVGGGGHVKMFDGKTGSERWSFQALEAEFRGGVTVGTVRVPVTIQNTVTGRPVTDMRTEIVTGAGPGGGARVNGWFWQVDGADDGRIAADPNVNFFAYDAGFAGGVAVAGVSVEGEAGRLVTAPLSDGGPQIRTFDLAAGASPVWVGDVSGPAAARGSWAVTGLGIDPTTGATRLAFAGPGADVGGVTVGAVGGASSAVNLVGPSGFAVSASPITAAGRFLQAALDRMQVESYWLPQRLDADGNTVSGTHIDPATGVTLGPRVTGVDPPTHCSAFATAVADLLGVDLLGSPEAPQLNLTLHQNRWLNNIPQAAYPGSGAAAGWAALDARLATGATYADLLAAAQDYANRGYLVVGIYDNAHADGHIGVVLPSEKADTLVRTVGPQMVCAGGFNLASADMASLFSFHPESVPADPASVILGPANMGWTDNDTVPPTLVKFFVYDGTGDATQPLPTTTLPALARPTQYPFPAAAVNE